MPMQLIFEQIAELQAQLSQLGVSPENIAKARALLESYGEVYKELEEQREIQFLNEAHNMLYETNKAPKTERDEVAALYLRRFAEHVATHLLGGDRKDIASLVDKIPPMAEPESE
jgi:uncharacterized protein YifE (UPF0438 family)